MHPQARRLIAFTVLMLPTVANAQHPGLTSISSITVDGVPATSAATTPSVSADGRFVAFASDASDVVHGDTNGLADVFVRDEVAGTTQRISITWDGQEPRGRSWCPSISDSGRYVAFVSDAWNMYEDGASSDLPIQNVYRHDRFRDVITRVTVSADGGLPDDHSTCPSISGDGERIAFSSRATNFEGPSIRSEGRAPTPLVPDHDGSVDLRPYVWDRPTGEIRRLDRVLGQRETSGWDATISGDGRFVAYSGHDLGVGSPTIGPPGIYVYDLEAGTRALAAPEGTMPALSYDGRYLAYANGSREEAFLRDRDTGSVVNVSLRRELDACGPPAAPFACEDGPIDGLSISGDGRYVAFSSRSLLLLPGATGVSEQVFLWDAHTLRLRRVSITRSGATGNGDSTEPSLSRDGHVIAYTTNAPDIVGEPANGTTNVVRTEWGCHREGACVPPSVLPSRFPECVYASDAWFRLWKAPPGGRGRDRFSFRWVGPPQEFGDPRDARYDLFLLVKGRTELDVTALPSQGWRETSRGWTLSHGDGGLSRLSFRRGARRSTIRASGVGPEIQAPYLPLPLPGYVFHNHFSVVLFEQSTNRCWRADMHSLLNEPGDASSAPRRPGSLRALQYCTLEMLILEICDPR